MTIIRLSKILDKSLFFLILFLFAFIPLYPKFPVLNISGTFVAVRWEDFFIALVLILWSVYILITKKVISFLKDNLSLSLMLFFTIGILSLFSAIFLTQSVTAHLGFLHFLRRVEFMLLLPIVATIFNSKKRVIFSLLVLSVVVFGANIYGLGQQYLDWPVISTTNREFSKGLILRLTPGARVNSSFAGHYDFAVFLAATLTFISVLFFAFNKFLKIAIFFLGAVSLFTLVLTAARISFIAAFIGIIAALILAGRKKHILLILIFLGLVMLYPSQLRDRFVSTVTINLLNLGQRYQGRDLDQRLEQKLNIPTLSYTMATRSASQIGFGTLSGGLPVDITPGEPTDFTDLAVFRSFQIRFDKEWPRAFNAFLKNPFLGTGYSSLDIATDNDLLRSLGEVGALGTIAFGLILVIIWKRICQGIKVEVKLIKCLSAGTLAMMVVFLVNGTFIDVFESSKVAILFWMIVGLNLGILKK